MLPLLILTLATISLCTFLILISYFFAPKDKVSQTKASSYECGLIPTKKKSSRISVKFFLTAILFILFDIEIIFMYPFALAYRKFLQSDQGLAILLSMLFFLLLFIFGLWWEIKTKALNWK